MVNEKRLSVLCDQEPIAEFEGFILRPFDEWNLWIENPLGEGMTIRKAEVLGFLVKLFKDRH